jgi:hypothetical protein
MFTTFFKQRSDEILASLRNTWVFWTFLIVFFFLLFVFSSLEWRFWAERTYDAKGTITETKIDRLKIVQQFGLLVAAMIGLALAGWRSHTSYRQASAALAQSKTAIRQTEISENGQRFDRYARAAQMLDSEKSAVRQAGIYLLRELALNDQNYRALCTELLASFIRSRNTDGMEQMASKETILFPPGRDSELGARLKFSQQQTPRDVIDALKTLCLTRADMKIEIDLDGLAFAKFRLDHHFNLANFDVTDCVFSQTFGYGAVFDSCTIIGASFKYLAFHQTNFRNASIFRTTFNNVDFEDVDFTDCSFQNCAFEACTFKICNVSGATFGTSDDQENKFDPKLLEKCWAWKDKPPVLGGEFVGDIYDPGSDGAERNGFNNRREKRRIAGSSPGLKPNTKLKIARSV